MKCNCWLQESKMNHCSQPEKKVPGFATTLSSDQMTWNWQSDIGSNPDSTGTKLCCFWVKCRSRSDCTECAVWYWIYIVCYLITVMSWSEQSQNCDSWAAFPTYKRSNDITPEVLMFSWFVNVVCSKQSDNNLSFTCGALPMDLRIVYYNS